MTPGRVQMLSAVGVFVLAVLLYLPTLRGGFVYDSIAQVLYGDYIHSPANWSEVLTLRVVGQDVLDRNRPLHLASLMADAAIWGKNPFGYRLTSVLLHTLNAALLFAVAATVLTRRTAGGGGATASFGVASPSPATAVGLLAAAFGALVFALHPLVVEAVAEPSNREDLLVLLPLLVGVLGIASIPGGSRTALSLLLVICSVLAVLAKESGIAVPFVFTAAFYLLRRSDLRGCVLALVAGLLAASAFLLASFLWRPCASAILVQAPAPLAFDYLASFTVQLRIWVLQFGQIVWPWNLSAHYHPEVIAGLGLPLASVCLALVAAAAVFAWRADRLAALGIAVYVLCLVPVSNFAAQYHPIADRFLYAPLAGVGLVAAAFTHRLFAATRHGFPPAALAAGLLALLAVEYVANLRRQRIWQQPATLWSDVLHQYPGSAQAFLGMANVHYRVGDLQAARTAATEAVVSSNGRWADAWAVRAVCEWQTGSQEQARSSLQEARRLSRAYLDKEALEKAMILSPHQMAVFEEIVAVP
jgi:hypothetical protein